MILMKGKFKQQSWNWSRLLWKVSLSSNDETGYDCCENKVWTVMVKLVTIAMKWKFKKVKSKLVMIVMKRKLKQ